MPNCNPSPTRIYVFPFSPFAMCRRLPPILTVHCMQVLAALIVVEVSLRLSLIVTISRIDTISLTVTISLTLIATLIAVGMRLTLTMTLSQLPQLLYPCSHSYCQTRRLLLTLTIILARTFQILPPQPFRTLA